jgi:hypothetical protein
VPKRLVVDAARERAQVWEPALTSAGYEVVESQSDLIVLGLPGASVDLFDALGSGVPVLAVIGPEAWEEGMRAAIEGAARCIAEPPDPGAVVAAVDAVLGPDAPPIDEQRRRARRRALTLLARFEARGAAPDEDDEPRSVHLTRLEHHHGRDAAEAAALSETRRRLTTLTTKQRGLLHIVEAEGGVAAAAARLGTSRGNVYAGLRRIVHRLGVHDTAELLELVGSGELLRAART